MAAVARRKTSLSRAGSKNVGQRVQLLRPSAGIDQHVDQHERKGLAGRRAADAEFGHQRPHVESARRRVDRLDRRAIDLHRRGVEEHGIVDLHGIAVQGRAGDKIEAAARGVDLVLQPHQHAAIAGVDVLQGHDVEPREDSHQALADLGVGQAVVVQAVEIERRQADRRAGGGRRRLVGGVFAGRAARRPCAARSARIGTFLPRCDGPPANSSPRHTNRRCPARRPLPPGYCAT